MYLVGEQVPQSVCDTWGATVSLYNMYGPTEATCGATIKRLLPGEAVNLGHPNPSTRVYVLDRNFQLLPPGAVGEVFLAGIQVSKGYIGLPEQNADRFLDDTILPESNEKMYRTGDLGYFEPTTGEIHLLGRNDRQIKLRGYRLDLHDLEVRAARALPFCDGVAIFRRNDYLVAAVKNTAAGVETIRSSLTKELPPYAMPRRIICLDTFPLTPAGKLDYKALDGLEQQERTKEEPTTLNSIEELVASAWRHVLKADPAILIDKDSNFLSVGGHSILQLQLASHLSTILKRRINIRTVIENPVLSDMARIVSMGRSGRRLSKSYVGPISKSLGLTGVSPIEQDWFMKYQTDLGTSAFNVSYLCNLDDTKVDRDSLVKAFNAVLSRHDIMRSKFIQTGDRIQRALFDNPPEVSLVDSFRPRKAINTEFDLSNDLPIRVLLSSKQLLVCISHIICDLTTLEVLLSEVVWIYNGTTTLPPPSRLYSDTEWSTPIEADVSAFWQQYLSGIDFTSKPYLSRPRTSYTGTSQLYTFPSNRMTTLDYLTTTHKITVHQAALALVSLALQDPTSPSPLLLGGPYFGRSASDLSTIGLFLQPFPILIPSLSHSSSVSTYLSAVRQSAQSALAHALPWDQLLSLLNQESVYPNHALFDAMVTFHDNRAAPKLPIDGLSPVMSWAEGAKFGIMFEFTAVSESTLTLRIEYDTDLFSFEQIGLLGKRVSAGLRTMSEMEAVGDVAMAMREGVEGEEMVSVAFGTAVDAL